MLLLTSDSSLSTSFDDPPHNKNVGAGHPRGHRVSTPLELLFDLTFATAFAVVGQQLSQSLSQGNVAAALLSLGISMVAICWAWMSYSWSASAYVTDDWTFRSATMVKMWESSSLLWACRNSSDPAARRRARFKHDGGGVHHHEIGHGLSVASCSLG